MPRLRTKCVSRRHNVRAWPESDFLEMRLVCEEPDVPVGPLSKLGPDENNLRQDQRTPPFAVHVLLVPTPMWQVVHLIINLAWSKYLVSSVTSHTVPGQLITSFLIIGLSSAISSDGSSGKQIKRGVSEAATVTAEPTKPRKSRTWWQHIDRHASTCSETKLPTDWTERVTVHKQNTGQIFQKMRNERKVEASLHHLALVLPHIVPWNAAVAATPPHSRAAGASACMLCNLGFYSELSGACFKVDMI